MASMTEPIIVQIVNESGVGNVKSAAPGSTKTGANAGNIGALAGGLTKMLGMGAIIVEVLKMVGDAIESVIKPIKTVLSATFKLIAQLLRPIADVIMMLLMPFLQFLKPIIKVFNDIMRPYRTLAYRIMKSNTNSPGTIEWGEKNGLAIETLFAGFAVAITGVLAELLKTQLKIIESLILNLIIYPFIDIFGGLIGFFTGQSIKELKDSAKNAFDIGIDFVNKGIDAFVKDLNKTTLEYFKTQAAQLGVDIQGIDISAAKNAIMAKVQSLFDIQNSKTPYRPASYSGYATGSNQISGYSGNRVSDLVASASIKSAGYTNAASLLNAFNTGTLKTNAKVTK